MPGLFADLDAGSASVALGDEFLAQPPDVRTRILQQWMRAFGRHRDAALVEVFREFAEELPDQTIVRQIEHFRHHCSVHGLACPTDFAVLLQRY